MSQYNRQQAANRRALLLARARYLRFNPTYTEAKLWQAIRGKRRGVQFRRQGDLQLSDLHSHDRRNIFSTWPSPSNPLHHFEVKTPSNSFGS